MATISDVARLAGVSKATVSRVINGLSTVTEENKICVINAMKELQYTPNISARNLRNKKTRIIAVVVQKIANPFFGTLVQTMGIKAEELGYQLIVCQSCYKKEIEKKFLNLLKTKQVDGIIFASIHQEWEEIKPFIEEGPIVLCNEYMENALVPMVYIDHQHASYISTKHLIEQGHTQLGYCVIDKEDRVGSQRFQGFLKALQEFGLTFNPEHYFTGAFGFEDGREIFYRIKSLQALPTALFTGSDDVAAGIISEAKKNNWKVPDDLAVIGFDNLPISKIIEPSLTTIEQPIKKIGEKAVEILIEIIESGLKVERKLIEYPVELVVRDSSIKILR